MCYIQVKLNFETKNNFADCLKEQIPVKCPFLSHIISKFHLQKLLLVYHLRKNLEEKVYGNKPGTFEASQIKIWNIILEITEDDHYMLWNLLHWCGMYFDVRRDHCSR
jgi:hypothetical protein